MFRCSGLCGHPGVGHPRRRLAQLLEAGEDHSQQDGVAVPPRRHFRNGQQSHHGECVDAAPLLPSPALLAIPVSRNALAACVPSSPTHLKGQSICTQWHKLACLGSVRIYRMCWVVLLKVSRRLRLFILHCKLNLI